MASPDLRHKISLARALYYDADVFLIDDVFADMNINSVRKILSNFERLLPYKTLLISTELTSVIRPNDHVLIFDRGTAVEYGLF
jgi:ATP-binding cassette subfamily C (CFTR/MRP) protein 1